MNMPAKIKGLEDLKVVDADTHYTEPHDLWTSRVPAKFKSLMPHVVRKDNGRDVWLFNGDQVLNEHAGAACAVMKNGAKFNFWNTDIMEGPQLEEVHESSWDIKERVKMMDTLGIQAQLVYPNVVGFGAHRLMSLEDQTLARDIVGVYNDAMADLQQQSGERFFPQAILPFWDIKAAVKELERAKGLGLRGITACAEPHYLGLPDCMDRHWDPLWQACSDLEVPINFHLGSAPPGHDIFDVAWPSQDKHRRWVIAMALLESGMSRVLANLVTGDLLVRFPKTKWVIVESGIGWIPFILERMEYQLYESRPEPHQAVDYDRPSPSELFKRQVYACFWFEKAGPERMLDVIGIDNVLFESDFPHPTCLFPSPVEKALKSLEPWGPEAQRKVMGGNAAKLYNIPL